MSERKIVQIAAAPSPVYTRLFALASDGTLWVRNDTRFDEWADLPALPQPEKSPCPLCGVAGCQAGCNHD